MMPRSPSQNEKTTRIAKYVQTHSTVTDTKENRRTAIWFLFAMSLLAVIFSGSAYAQQTNLRPGQIYLGPNANNFGRCKLRHGNGQSVSAHPHFVLRVPDNRGLAYGFNDNYSLPFPTPWVSDTGGTCPTSHNGCIAKPDVYKYEHALMNNITGLVHHQFKIYELIPFYKGDPSRYSVGAVERFYNGTRDSSVLDKMNAVTTQYASKPTVKSSTMTCVYVLQEVNGTLVYTGCHSCHTPIGEEHG